ncbi:MAG: peptidylprolyl isomerase [Chloroflexi bacterium]|nr:peptidylprolyl isomerase [Chloroflexota bacterium]
MSTQKITDGTVVSLAYTLTVDGKEVARQDADEPLEYLHGAQNIIPGLEAALEGRTLGDKFSLTVTPDDGYGQYDDDDVEEIKRENIPDFDELDIGMVVEVEDEEGFTYLAHVVEIKDDAVRLDFNPPLAGKTLNYEVEVVALRAATDAERSHGHVHGGMFEDDDEEE